ncbi:MAG: class I adenylate-forming enzyme family protein, partial [Anaerolineales bacterium]
MNLVDVFLGTVATQPDHPAILGPGRDDTWSYQDLAGHIERTAALLRDAGIGADDTVGLHYPSSREYIVYTYALWRCGASVAPIAVELVSEEKEAVCRGIYLTAVISRTSAPQVFAPFQSGTPVPLGGNVVLIPLKPGRGHPDGFTKVNPAFLRFSSGTTGASKGIILSHETIHDRIQAANVALQLGPDDRVVWLLSMSYHFAVSIVAYLTFGATILLCRNHFGSTIVKTTAEHQGTFIYGSPVHYDLMAHDRSGTLLPGVRLAISTAMYLRDEIAESFYRRFNLPLSEAYGIIEVGLPCINHDRPLEKRGSVGRVLPDYEIRIEDAGLGEDLGAIKLKGKGFLDAYYNPWQPRDDIMADGWFATGDLGYLDADGYLFIQGRSKEIINIGGMKFFPQEVETVLESHPAIREACVFPHKDNRMGEVPYAQVVLQTADAEPTREDELKDYCA